jgi:hypothetical protein
MGTNRHRSGSAAQEPGGVVVDTEHAAAPRLVGDGVQPSAVDAAGLLAVDLLGEQPPVQQGSSAVGAFGDGDPCGEVAAGGVVVEDGGCEPGECDGTGRPGRRRRSPEPTR